MKEFGLINMGVLPLLLEAMSPISAHQEPRAQDVRPSNQEKEAKPKKQHQPVVQEHSQPAKGQQERRRQEARGQQDLRQQQERARIQQDQRRDGLRQPQAARPPQQAQREHEGEHRSAWRERRALNWKSEHRTWQDRGGYRGYRIPEARYHGRFGTNHPFRMFRFPLLVIEGYPRFQYGGLWFSVMDPWPEYWSDNWYSDDDMFIESFGDGYYLCNRRHPMDRIAVHVYVD